MYQVKKYVRDESGRYTEKTNWKTVAFLASFALILAAYIYHITLPVEAQNAPLTPIETLEAEKGASECLEVSNGHFDCNTDIEVMKKWEAFENKNETVKFKAVRTIFSRKDSCHNPRVLPDGRVECLTAIGRDTKEGVTIACPRSMLLGTRLLIPGVGVRVCEDRYAEFLDKERGLPTVDVFYEAENMDSIPGREVVEVTILK